MGLPINMNPSPPVPQSLFLTHKIFLLCNYILLGASSSCIFLTLSLRLVPSVCGFFFILLHILTISVAIAGCTAATYGSNKWYVANMVTTVLTAIFQGSVSAMIFMETSNFLGFLKSYVKEEDGGVILRMAGGLCVLIFCLEWVVLSLSFVLRFHAFAEGNLASNGSVDMMRNKPLFNV